MKVSTGIRFQEIAPGVLRPFLCLDDGTMIFEAQKGSGAYIHIISTYLNGADCVEAEEKASSHLGSLQPMEAIELDEGELNVLKTYYRVHR